MSGTAAEELPAPVVLRKGSHLFRGSSLHGSSTADPYPPSGDATFYLTRSKTDGQEYGKESPHILWSYELTRDLVLCDQRPLARDDAGAAALEHPICRAILERAAPGSGDDGKGSNGGPDFANNLRSYFCSLAKPEAPSAEDDTAALEVLPRLSISSSSSGGPADRDGLAYEGIIRTTWSDYLGRNAEEVVVQGRVLSVNDDKQRRCSELLSSSSSSSSSCTSSSSTKAEKERSKGEGKARQQSDAAAPATADGPRSQRLEAACPVDKPGDRNVFPSSPVPASSPAAISLIEMLKCRPEKGKVE